MKQPALLRVRPALMLDASAGSLRKAPGLSSYLPPRDKPGAGPLVRAGLFTGAPSAIESWATPGRRPRSQPRAPLKRSISAWRGGEQILQPHPRPNQRTEALAPGEPGLNARTAAPIHVPPDDAADDNDSRDDPHPRNVCGSGGRSLC